MTGLIAFSHFLILIAVSLGIYRLIKGPSRVDQAVALEFLALTVMSYFCLWAMITGYAEILDLLLVWAILSFAGNVAVARYLAKVVR